MDTRACEFIVQRLIELDVERYFIRPISESLAKEPRLLKRYLREIIEPMDFTSIQHKLRDGKYDTRNAFLRDIRLVFTNAKAFNESGSLVHEKALELSDELDSMLASEGDLAFPEHDDDESIHEEIADVDYGSNTNEGHSEQSCNRNLEQISIIEPVKAASDNEGVLVSSSGPTETAALLASDVNLAIVEEHEGSGGERRDALPAFHLPLPKANRRSLWTTEAKGLTSFHQWDVEMSADLVRTAEQVGFASERLVLPCFAYVGKQKDKLLQFRSKKRCPDQGMDVSWHEPKAKKDAAFMFSIYRKLVGDAFEKALHKGPSNLRKSRMVSDDEPPLPGPFRDLFTFNIPGPEFVLLVEEFSTPEERERYKRTTEKGQSQMVVFLPDHKEMRRLFGMSAVRVAMGSAKNTFSLIKEPLRLSLLGHTMTVQADVALVNQSELPKEFSSVKGPGRVAGRQVGDDSFAGPDDSAFA